MVAEPKAHQTGRKRQNAGNTGNDWEFYYDSYAMGPQRMTPPMKRARMGGAGQQRSKGKSGKTTKLQPVPFNQLNTYNTPDILICGNCKETFAGLQKLVEHKKTKCKLRFSCKCASSSENQSKADNEPVSFLCATCKEKFGSCWDLVYHVQSTHQMNIYEIPPESTMSDEEKKDDQDKKDDELGDSNNVDCQGDDNGDDGDQDGENIDEETLLQDEGGAEGEDSQDS